MGWDMGGTIGCDDVGDLNDWIDRGLRKYSRPSSAFNIKTQHPQRRNLSPLPLRRMGHDIPIRDLTFNLSI